MRNYLDPKHDLLFKRIFGKHSDLLKSLLNALLPLEEKQYITNIEYFPDEIKENLPTGKSLDVTAFCEDNRQEKFIVTTQMYRNTSFQNQLLFNVTNSYVRQYKLNGNYHLFPVYGLGFINTIFNDKNKEYYHHYCLCDCSDGGAAKGMNDMEFVMIELPKFTAASIPNNQKIALWLRFLRDVEENKNIPLDLWDDDDIRQAIELCDVNKFTDEEIYNYKKYQEIIHTKNATPDTE
ncbi:MAG: Rpn family recombination-promoting nuclease/putative transposase [Bacteroidales bacterium]|jgi:predicted transposase/invertase (TIGR01784 family)|nr:Rpn family recombination-promoting nuclease/putative transposase [Bacteroidales bacterium]